MAGILGIVANVVRVVVHYGEHGVGATPLLCAGHDLAGLDKAALCEELDWRPWKKKPG
jgi:hypothetical protein